MPFITNRTAGTGNEVKIYYEDAGSGKPVVLIHGWPLSGAMWEYQVQDLTAAGYRCITYDRRGFGCSDRPWTGYDYDTLASDLKVLIDELQLGEITLIGFSMGGGEVARYLGTYGSAGISKAVFISAVTPYLLKTNDNPAGVDSEVFAGITMQIKEDRLAFLQDFSKMFYGVNLLNKPVSQAVLDYNFGIASMASPKATLDCAAAFAGTDFRTDVAGIEIPVLIIHGDADKTVPIESSGNKTAELLPAATYLVYEGAPHGLFITDREKLSNDLISFIG